MSNVVRRCCECGTVLNGGETVIEAGDLFLNSESRKASWRGEPVHLPATCYNIVELLARRAGRTVPRESFYTTDILADDVGNEVLQVHIYRVRRAFRKVDPDFDALEVDWGVGYRWAA